MGFGNMLNSRYNKVLTVILVIVIIAVIGLLVFFGYDVYKKYYIEKESDKVVSRFEGQLNELMSEVLDAPSVPTTTNTIEDTNTVVSPGGDLDLNVLYNETGGSSGGSSGGNKVTYKGYNVIGTIKIPKTDIEYPILDQVSIRSLEASIGYIYGTGDGLNTVGNCVLVGHNYRNGTFFSNNKKLEKGDKIYITDSSGKKVTYVVTKKYETSTNDFDYATRDVNGKREISLSTCTDDTKKRLIIWAVEE